MPYPLTGNQLSATTTKSSILAPTTITPTRTTPGLVGSPRIATTFVYPGVASTTVVTPPTTGQIWPRSATPGSQGATGPPGVQGAAGSKWFNGTGAPSLVTGAVDGDYYIDNGTGQYYYRSGGSWALKGKLKGTSWFTGHGPPPTPVPGAVPGDLYLDVDTGNVWSL
jgi:hypothetical protein